MTTVVTNEDVYQDPAIAIANYNKWGLGNDDYGIDESLFDYLGDQSACATAVFDIETTELIERSVPISAMKVSVATVLLLKNDGGRETHIFWNTDEGTPRGAPLRFLRHVLDSAERIVAYNGRDFDLVVLAGGGDAQRLERWRSKLFDPFVILRAAFRSTFKLDALLKANGLDPKTGKGSEAPAMWKLWLDTRDDRHLVELECYNVRDVEALEQLVLLPSVIVPGFCRTDDISLQKARVLDAFPTFENPRAPQRLVQGSSEWLAFRKHKIGASDAAAFLRLDFRCPREDAFERLICGDASVVVETNAMQLGKKMEPKICSMYAEKFGVCVVETGSWPHPSLDWLFASPDRLVVSDVPRVFSLLEVKFVSERLHETIPDHHLVQLQVQLACVPTAAHVDYAASDGKSLMVQRVRRDPELFSVIVRNLGNVFDIASPVFNGQIADDHAFVEDAPFGRQQVNELRDLLNECRSTHVKREM
tara:strand:+ start:6544 stop:7974 length:1431 start_codon:yes stop_codon:yes gene_type:complete